MTKTSSKGRDLKTKLIEKLREHVEDYDRVFVLSYDNMRASKFKDIRMDWRESKIYLGKMSVAQVALGRGAEDEYKDNLCRVSEVSTDPNMLVRGTADGIMMGFFFLSLFLYL